MQTESSTPLKPSVKLLVTGVLTALTVVVAGMVFDGLGVMYGPSQAILSMAVGFVGSLQLLSN